MVSAWTIFWISLRLGVTSFGGPIAHLGYFRDEFVNRRRWLDDETYADIVALSQFAPGPASSQTLYAIGLLKSGFWGGAAAWAGFTLPSALLMLAAAYGLAWAEGDAAQSVIHGLRIVAVAVVAQALWSMANSLCPDRTRAGLALAAAAFLIAAPSAEGQLAVIAAGAVAGALLLKPSVSGGETRFAGAPSRAAGVIAFILFAAIFAGSAIAARLGESAVWDVFDGFYRAGALVFGGGHVVLPLLEEATVGAGLMGESEFLAGYGAAQAVPGPLFTFAAYLGALIPLEGWPAPAVAALCLVALFLPGILLMYAGLPFWGALRGKRGARAVLNGVNAAVVGLLGAALYDPIATSAIGKPADLTLAIAAFGALTVLKLPVLVVVAATVAGAAAPTLIGWSAG